MRKSRWTTRWPKVTRGLQHHLHVAPGLPDLSSVLTAQVTDGGAPGRTGARIHHHADRHRSLGNDVPHGDSGGQDVVAGTAPAPEDRGVVVHIVVEDPGREAGDRVGRLGQYRRAGPRSVPAFMVASSGTMVIPHGADRTA